MRRPARDGDEQDCFYARKFYIWRPGQAKAIKTRANRRDRREIRAELRGDSE